MQYGLTVDPSGTIAALWRPVHLIGLELGISVASAALRGDCQARSRDRRGAGRRGRRDRLGPAGASEDLDRRGGLPIGLAHGVKMTRRVTAGRRLSLGDVAIDRDEQALRLRQSMLAA